MPRPIDDDGNYYARRDDHGPADREISLGTPTILAIFFALALVCACFFGFGYTMGHNSARAAESSGASIADPASGVTDGAPKPDAGSIAARPIVPAALPPADSTASSTAPTQTATVSLTPPAATKDTVAPSDRIIAGDKLPATTPPATASPLPATSFVVQVAAVSTQDIADIEVAALKKDGYAVVVRHEPQDKLLHVQIGPFPDRKSAEAMQKRVLADGFNAIVK